MAGRGEGFDREVRPLQPLAVGEDRVGRIVAIVRGIETGRPVAVGRKRHRPDHPRAGCRGELFCAGAVIAMGVGDEDRFDSLALDRGEDRGEMRIVLRSRIDDCDRASADDVGARAVEGEGRGVRRDEASNQRRNPGQRPRRRLARCGDGNRFAFVVGHLHAVPLTRRPQGPRAALS